MKIYHKLPTLLSSVLIVMSMSVYGQEEEPLSPQELEKFISINAQDIVNAREHRAALQRQFDEKLQQLREENQQLKATVEKLTQTLEQTAASTKAYANTRASQAEQAAKSYTNTRASQAEQTAKDYTNTRASKAEQTAKDYTNTRASQAETYASSRASQAESAAKSYAGQIWPGGSYCIMQQRKSHSCPDGFAPGGVIFKEVESSSSISYWGRNRPSVYYSDNKTTILGITIQKNPGLSFDFCCKE